MAFSKKKILTFGAAAAAIIVIALLLTNNGDGPQYVLAEALNGEIVQTVSVTGSIKADPTIDLHFKKGGEVKEILILEGARVKKEQVLASLENRSLELEIKRNQANLSYANAEYNRLKAGSKAEEIQIAEADVKSAQASLDATKAEAINTKSINESLIKQAELSYKQAQDNAAAAEKDLATTKALAENEIEKLKLEGATNLNTVALENAYTNARTKMAAMLPILQDSMYLAEKIVGAKGLGTSDIPESERYKFFTALYTTAEKDLAVAVAAYSSLKSDSTNEEIEGSLQKTITAGNSMSALLVFLAGKLQDISYYGQVIGNLIVQVTSQATTLTNSLASLTEVQKSILNLKTSTSQDTETLILNYQLKIDAALSAYKTSLNALEKAAFDLSQAKLNAENSNKNMDAQAQIKEAALNAAQASLNLRKSPVRNTDLSPLSAQISLAQIALEIAQNEYRDSQLVAPIDGLVTFIHGKVGQNVALSETALKSFVTIQADNLIVEANIPETDVSKVKPGDKVTMTIDAFDFSEKFEGKVVYVDPAETVIQGVVYYQLKAAFDLKDERLKSGMTTNMDIVTAEKNNILMIPARAIKYEDSIRYVEVLNNGKPIKTIIKTGLENDQYVEVLEGLKEGDKIITFVK
jgi:RND family efflux transporter MFP subunit